MTRHLKAIPQADLDRAAALRSGGASWADAAREAGVHEHTLRRRLDPDFAARVTGRSGPKLRDAGIIEPSVDRDLVDSRRAQIPHEDPRTLTARLMGDPIPGDRRRADAHG